MGWRALRIHAAELANYGEQMKQGTAIVAIAALSLAFCADRTLAINGGTLRVNPIGSWKGFEVITTGDDPAGGVTWAMPLKFDGVGAWAPDAATLRLLVNHENSDATVSELNLNLTNFKAAIRNMIGSGSTGGVSFVNSARQAYGRWSANGGGSWTTTSDVSTTDFFGFCSGQLHWANAFGAGRGFADNIYITGEETFDVTGRLMALDIANRDFYAVSGYAGSAPGGIGGMPFDSFENAALLDTGETNHVALLLSPDGGSETMQLYIGQKGKGPTGAASSSFLARNGLAYGSHYYLNDTLPALGTPSTNGFFDTSETNGLTVAKLEDVDTNPNDPQQAVLGVQESGLFTLDFNLNFGGGSFNAAGSSFSVTKIQNHNNNTDGLFGDADNVDWTAATKLGGVSYPNGLIFVNEDSGTANGETWMMTPTGSGLTKIADTAPNTDGGATTETSGILDISTLVGYKPGSILVLSNQGTLSSLSVLINPNAALAGDFNGNGRVDGADYVLWRKGLGSTYTAADYNIWRSQFGQTPSSLGSGAGWPDGGTVPEPGAFVLMCWIVVGARRVGRGRMGV
jgi:hypothetical protein